MPFTNGMTGTVQVDDSILLEFDQEFISQAAQMNVMDQFVSYRKRIGAKSISLPKYDQLDPTLDTTPLTQDEDVDSEALNDSEILLTPAEHGKVVTKTELASLQTGGTVDRAAARLVGMHQGRLYDRLAIEACLLSTNVVLPDGVAAEINLAATDVATPTFLNKLYNKIARTNIMPLPNGDFVAVMHDDVIHDLRKEAGTGSWQDISKYSRPEEVFKNEIGRLAGFRIVRDNNIFPNADAGAGAVDSYDIIVLGFNGLGKADSLPPGMVMSGPFDKLQRFVNMGWKGVTKYSVVDEDAVYIGKVASSVGANV